MRGSPGAGQSSAAPQHSPSSAQPLQSLSSLSHDSGVGPIDPTQSPHAPNSAEPKQVCVPSVQAPTLCLPGGPRKHGSTAPGVQAQPSSTLPLQSSSRPLPEPPQSSCARQPSLGAFGLAQLIPICPGVH